jgi:hypothetical protein
MAGKPSSTPMRTNDPPRRYGIPFKAQSSRKAPPDFDRGESIGHLRRFDFDSIILVGLNVPILHEPMLEPP